MKKSRLQEELQLPEISETCVLTTGPQPGLEAILGIPVLLVGLVIGPWVVALAVAASFGAVLSLNRRALTPVATKSTLILVPNSRVNPRRPIIDRAGAAVPFRRVSLRTLKESGGFVRVLLNGERFWAGPRDVRGVRRIAQFVDSAA